VKDYKLNYQNQQYQGSQYEAGKWQALDLQGLMATPDLMILKSTKMSYSISRKFCGYYVAMQ
jgi:hypothetical protein